MYKRQTLLRIEQRKELAEVFGFETRNKYAVALEDGKDLPVSYTHLRAHETVLDLVCRLLLEKKKYKSIYGRHSTHDIQ